MSLILFQTAVSKVLSSETWSTASWAGCECFNIVNNIISFIVRDCDGAEHELLWHFTVYSSRGGLLLDLPS